MSALEWFGFLAKEAWATRFGNQRLAFLGSHSFPKDEGRRLAGTALAPDVSQARD
jgi:hypothetical protein